MMAGEVVSRPGPIEGTGRVLRELLRTPRFKKTVTDLLNALDPENAAFLVRTLVREDPIFFLGLLGAAPTVANAGVNGLGELFRQFANFPAELLAGFMPGLFDDIDAEQAGEAAGLLLVMLARVNESGGAALARAGSDFGARFRKGVEGALAGAGEGTGSAAAVMLDIAIPALSSAAARLGAEAARGDTGAGEAVSKLADGISRIIRDNPEFVSSVVAPLVDAARLALADVEAAGEVS